MCSGAHCTNGEICFQQFPNFQHSRKPYFHIPNLIISFRCISKYYTFIPEREQHRLVPWDSGVFPEWMTAKVLDRNRLKIDYANKCQKYDNTHELTHWSLEISWQVGKNVYCKIKKSCCHVVTAKLATNVSVIRKCANGYKFKEKYFARSQYPKIV